jgi:hypothetical protein
VHDKHLEGFRAPEHVALLLEERAVCIAVGTISDQERDAIRGEDVYGDLQPVLDSDSELLMGRLMVALDQIQDALTLGRAEESAGRVALLRAVTDWYRVAMPTTVRSALRPVAPGGATVDDPCRGGRVGPQQLACGGRIGDVCSGRYRS